MKKSSTPYQFNIKWNKLGFTLVETIITLMIMAVLTIMAARTIQQAFKARNKIQNQIDQVSQVKDSLRLMERDINLAYHHLDLQKELAEELAKTQKTAPPSLNPSSANPWATPPPPLQSGLGTPLSNNPFLKTENRVSPATQFFAKESEMHFVTMNTVRLMKDSPQADFGEVSYYVDTCKYRPDKKFESGKCLFRRTSPLVDKEPTKGGTSTQLLTDVTEFNLRFYSLIQKDWRKDWNSKEDSGDNNTKNRYPEAVEVNLTVESPPKDPKIEKKKKVSLQLVIPIHFPNNKDPNTNNLNNGQPIPGQGSGGVGPAGGGNPGGGTNGGGGGGGGLLPGG